jgi:hypothetical protein
VEKSGCSFTAAVSKNGAYRVCFETASHSLACFFIYMSTIAHPIRQAAKRKQRCHAAHRYFTSNYKFILNFVIVAIYLIIHNIMSQFQNANYIRVSSEIGSWYKS